jgi:sec-independent protein translocase protein TatA
VFREISVWHLALILAAFVLLFGYKKLPDATRSLGRSMRIFKSEVKGLHDDEPKQVEPARAEPVRSETPRTEPVRAESTAPEAAAKPVERPSEVRTESDRS